MDREVIEETYVKEVFDRFKYRSEFEAANAKRVAKATKTLSYILNQMVLDESMKGRLITLLLDYRELVKDAFKDFPDIKR